MRIEDILRRKGGHVYTIAPTATLRELVELLSERQIGAALVVEGADILGIVSERDLVAALKKYDIAALSHSVADVMTKTVVTCPPTATTNEIADMMSAQRFRHVPVLEAGTLIGLVSIGDVVKQRVIELTTERDHLTAYISS